MLAVSGAIRAVGVAPSRFHVSAISVLATCVAEASQATEAREAAARPLVECRFWVRNAPNSFGCRLAKIPTSTWAGSCQKDPSGAHALPELLVEAVVPATDPHADRDEMRRRFSTCPPSLLIIDRGSLPVGKPQQCDP
jgi:hypothetical protein